MQLNAMRMRAAVMIAGALVLALCAMLGGRFTPRPVVQIEFGAYPEVFQGMTVEIDGTPAGTLEPFGTASRTGFEVSEGRHTVRVVHPLYASVARTIEAVPGRPVVLVVDLQAIVNARGQSQTALAFQN